MILHKFTLDTLDISNSQIWTVGVAKDGFGFLKWGVASRPCLIIPPATFVCHSWFLAHSLSLRKKKKSSRGHTTTHFEVTRHICEHSSNQKENPVESSALHTGCHDHDKKESLLFEVASGDATTLSASRDRWFVGNTTWVPVWHESRLIRCAMSPGVTWVPAATAAEGATWVPPAAAVEGVTWVPPWRVQVFEC